MNATQNGAEIMSNTTATYESALDLVNSLRGELEQLVLLPADGLELCDQLVARVELAKARADNARLRQSVCNTVCGPNDCKGLCAEVETETEAEDILARERAAARRAGKMAVAEEAEAKASFLAKTSKKAPGKAVLVEVEAGQWVEVTPRKSIRLHGVDRNRVNGPVAYDRTFAIGDTVEYDSYNTSFLGRIVSIGAKTVTIEARIGGRRRLTLEQFNWRNRHFDLETVAARNAEESYFI
jgi:hypothetical protein